MNSPFTRPTLVDPAALAAADLTILKMAVNGHDVPWIAQAAQTSIANVTHVLRVNGPGRDEWRAAVAAYRPDGLPERTEPSPVASVPRIVDLRGQETPRGLAVVPLPPEPAMNAAPALDHDERCGSEMTGGGAPRGWVLIRVVGAGTPKRWCSPECAVKSLGGQRAPVKRRGNPHPSNPAKGNAQRLRDIGVDAAAVRTWAISAGLAEPGGRGVIPGRLIDAYLAAHTTGATA